VWPKLHKQDFTASMRKALWPAVSVLTVAAAVSCEGPSSGSSFIVLRADRTVSGPSAYPLATDPGRVGTYPARTPQGPGYFYDEVLEYRVWLNPQRGALPRNGASDYVMTFAQYESAEKSSQHTVGAEEPLVLVRQYEWIDELEFKKYFARKGEGITEWQVQWLADGKRNPNSIEEFMKHPRPAPQDNGDEGNQ
jgi:hypothetical protein